MATANCNRISTYSEIDQKQAMTPRTMAFFVAELRRGLGGAEVGIVSGLIEDG